MPAALRVASITVSTAADGRVVKVWNGAAWRPITVRVRLGARWGVATVRVWNGTAWR
jgi:hypothetical protein